MLALAMLVGCGSIMKLAPATASSPLRGSVQSGHKPVTASAIQLYAVGTTGDGSVATPLLSQKVLTNSAGEFDLTGLYTCPSADSVLYVVARGGDPGMAEGTTNASLGLLAVLGSCSSLDGSTAVAVDEVSTVASIWPLAAYAESSAKIGFADASAFQAVADTVPSLATMSRQAASARVVDYDNTQAAKINSLADILYSCVNSTGGKAGDGTACGRLFTAMSGDAEAVPTNTIDAAISLAKSPLRNVAGVYELLPAESPFLPALASMPRDWSLRATTSKLHSSLSAGTVTMTPGSATLTPAQSQLFSVSIAGTTNQAVTWNLSPAVGTISASGVYTAPSTIAMTQVLTVRATSVANPSKSARALVTLLPPVTITETPASVPLMASQSRTFSAAVRGSTNKAVTWSLNPAVGSISANGVYTAPSTVSSAQTVTVTATSVADTSKSASGQVSLIPAVSIAMDGSVVQLAQTQKHTFSASITGSTNHAVRWTLSPIFGSISASGVYTAPATVLTPATVRVTATSVADISKIATATVQLSDPVSVSMTPGGVALGQSQTNQFSATVAGIANQAVTWKLNLPVGSISPSGLYTAPSRITMVQVLTVTATSVGDPLKTARALITLMTPVSISASPAYASLTVNQSRQFTSTVGGNQNKAVTWSVSPAVGSVSATGVYTAPATIAAQQVVTVTATSAADSSKTASGQVTLIPPVIVSVTPGSLSLTPSQMQIFNASVSGSPNQSVTWSVSPALGSISAVGLYMAPATVNGTQTVSVIATSKADTTKSATTVVTLSNPASAALSPGSVSLLPTVVTLLPSQARQFSATIADTSNQAVTWSLDPAVGSLTAGGLYTAPGTITTSQTVRITATSVANPLQSETATVQLFGGTPTLRELGAARGVLMGTAADADELGQSSPLRVPIYSSTLSTQYSMLEPENALKWFVVQRTQGVFDFEPGDALVSFAEANGMQVRGHNLCWYRDNPAWLASLSSDELYTALHDHIFATMQHYKGKVFAWDVVNEAIRGDANGIGTLLNDSVWYNKPGIGLSGTGYIEQAFRWAREADPSAKLFYNDDGIEVAGGKSQALVNMLKDFISRGVPIDGVGLEMHIDTGANFPTTLAATLKSYTDLGLEVHITEMDVRLPVNASGVASAADLQAEANAYSFVVKTCLENPHCTAIQTWGFSDKWSWIGKQYPGFGAGLPFDLNYQPKPAYNAIVNALETE